MKKMVGVVNVATGATHKAPSHCPYCGHDLGELIRHVGAAMFEATCEAEGCGKTSIVMDDHQVMR